MNAVQPDSVRPGAVDAPVAVDWPVAVDLIPTGSSEANGFQKSQSGASNANGASNAGLAMSSARLAQTRVEAAIPATQKPLPRVGIVGTGNRGVRTFGALLRARRDVELVALCDLNAARLDAASHILGGKLEKYSDLPRMLERESLDGLVVTTPDFWHSQHILAALRAGVKHVLVDKPLAISVAGCLEVARATRQCEATVAVGFNLRHHALIRAIKELIQSGELGELMLIENREFYSGGRTYHARWNRFRELSGGLWVHKGSHDFDVFNWWNEGGNPSRVMASAGLNAFAPDKIPLRPTAFFL